MFSYDCGVLVIVPFVFKCVTTSCLPLMFLLVCLLVCMFV